VRALRLDAFRRGLHNTQWPGVDDSFLAADFFHQCPLTGQYALGKNRVAGMEAQGLATINQFHG
jgi:hypothetical protein